MMEAPGLPYDCFRSFNLEKISARMLFGDLIFASPADSFRPEACFLYIVTLPWDIAERNPQLPEPTRVFFSWEGFRSGRFGHLSELQNQGQIQVLRHMQFYQIDRDPMMAYLRAHEGQNGRRASCGRIIQGAFQAGGIDWAERQEPDIEGLWMSDNALLALQVGENIWRR